MRSFWVSLFGFLSFVVLFVGLFRPDMMESALVATGTLLWWFGNAALGAIALVAIFSGVLLFRRQEHESLRQRDGSFPMLKRKRKDGVTEYFDPNGSVHPHYSFHPQHGWVIEGPPVPVQAQMWHNRNRSAVQLVQASHPSDRALVDMSKHGVNGRGPALTAGFGSLFRTDPTMRKAFEEATGEAPAQLAGPTIDGEIVPSYEQALGSAKRGQIAYGWRENGELFFIDVDETPHVVISGSTGSGKTESVKTGVVSLLQQHASVVVLDAKPNLESDWQVFGRKVQLARVDARNFGDYVRGIQAEFERRQQGTGSTMPIWIICEEFLRAFGWLKKEELQVLDDIAYVGRSFGLHMIMIAQQVRALESSIKNNSLVLTYRQGTQGGGSQAGIYNAHLLKRGQFFVTNGDQGLWNSFYLGKDLRRYLADFPNRTQPIITPIPLIDKRSGDAFAERSGSNGAIMPKNGGMQNVPATNEIPLPGRYGKWSRLVAQWFRDHPDYLQAPTNVENNRLARMMAVEEYGNEDNYEAFKSTASEACKAYKAAWHEAGQQQRASNGRYMTLEELRAVAADEPMYVAGQRVGQDKSRTWDYRGE